MEDMFKKWLLFHIYWLNSPVKMLVVHFEDLRSNKPQQLHRIMHFLNRTLTDEVLNCVLEHPGKSRPHKDNVDNPYESIDQSLIESINFYYGIIREMFNQIKNNE